MNRREQIKSLDTLVHLRSSEVDKLQTELARQEATRARYQANLARLNSLAEGSGASGKGSAGTLAPALALNCGQYKQAVFALVDAHRTDLQLHEANMAVSQRNLAQAWTRRELLGKVLEQQQDALAREQDRAARKREDEIATQSWLAGRA
ncbi:flagellar export protein FliJ [Massilia sp. Leaf139]|uniref:flagellar export protein FliJ n=1 Tax=Massilia sp. Leaf139 TaxID=1736272 RepID=UPI0007013EBC|nr:flagellar export protein FliJ [Massilia sp. Leaf139]KQQ91592.1 flagellar export protein FliJ [Massilia sp. Leaf139]